MPALARQDLSRLRAGVPSLVDAAADSLIRDVWDLGQTTIDGVKSDPERNPSVLADRIELRAQEYLSECVGEDPNAERPWLVGGATVRQSTLTYHLLNETIVHGYDIAQAAGQPWPIEPAHAAMVWGRFLVPVFQALHPRAMVASGSSDVKATFEILIRGGDSFHFIFNHGELTVEEPSSRTVDCYISADPVAIFLVAWGRASQWPLVAEGKLETWGPKAYLGPNSGALSATREGVQLRTTTPNGRFTSGAGGPSLFAGPMVAIGVTVGQPGNGGPTCATGTRDVRPARSRRSWMTTRVSRVAS